MAYHAFHPSEMPKFFERENADEQIAYVQHQ
jgi:hypothetical protein